MVQDNATDLERPLAQAQRQLSEALERQVATDEVLRVISSSPGDLQPVFNTMLENALRICEAKFGVLFRIDDEVTYPVAMLNLPPAFDQYLRQRERRQRAHQPPASSRAGLISTTGVPSIASRGATCSTPPLSIARRRTR